MRTLKTLALLVAFTFSTVLFASTNPKTVNPTSLNKEITKLLENPKFGITEEIEAVAVITLNKYSEIVVLSVDSKNLEVVNFIKKRLNYHKVKSNLNAEKVIVPVRLVKN